MYDQRDALPLRPILKRESVNTQECVYQQTGLKLGFQSSVLGLCFTCSLYLVDGLTNAIDFY